jgi:hypothetical protein
MQVKKSLFIEGKKAMSTINSMNLDLKEAPVACLGS